MASGVPADKEQSDGERYTGCDNINPSAAVRPLSCSIGSFCAFNSFGRRFKCPRDDQRDRKAYDEKENYEAHHPIGDFEKWKNLAGDLHQQPRHNRVRGCNFVNVAPLQFGEERRFLAHEGAGRPSFARKLL
jgi:hypothetical protein